MDSPTIRRRAVALIAAYALALHGLLLALAPIAPGILAGPLAGLCTHDSGDGTGQDQPGQHDLPCAALCAAMGHGIAGPVPAEARFAVAVIRDAAVPLPTHDWTPPRRFLSGPQIPRGPPLA